MLNIETGGAGGLRSFLYYVITGVLSGTLLELLSKFCPPTDWLVLLSRDLPSMWLCSPCPKPPLQPFRTRKTWFLAHESASGVPEVKPPSLRMALTWLCSQTRSRASAPKRVSRAPGQGAGGQAGTNLPAFHGRSLEALPGGRCGPRQPLGSHAVTNQWQISGKSVANQWQIPF